MAKAKEKLAGHNSIDAEMRELFLRDKDLYAKAKKRSDDASNSLRTLVKTIKGDGFSLRQIKLAVQLESPEGEADYRALVANDLLAAAYVGADIGDQLNLWLEPSRVPATDRAWKEGEKCSMENRAAVPPYDPSTPQHKAFMSGFHAHQESMIKRGIGKLDAKAAKANKPGKKATAKVGKPKGKPGRPKKAPEPDLLEAAEKPAGTTLIKKADKDAKVAARAQAAAAAKDSGPPRKPAAAPVTRASLAAQKAANREEADSYFSKSETKGNA